jgi:hypothetical protein
LSFSADPYKSKANPYDFSFSADPDKSKADLYDFTANEYDLLPPDP